MLTCALRKSPPSDRTLAWLQHSFVTHCCRSTHCWRHFRWEETVFNSLAMLSSVDRALRRLTEAMLLSTFGLLGTHRPHWPVPHYATPPTTSDMTTGSAANFCSQQLGNTKPHLITIARCPVLHNVIPALILSASSSADFYSDFNKYLYIWGPVKSCWEREGDRKSCCEEKQLPDVRWQRKEMHCMICGCSHKHIGNGGCLDH
jgi:hypothetical protein